MTNLAALKILLACQPDAGCRDGETHWSIVALWEEAFHGVKFPEKTYLMCGISVTEKDFPKAKSILFSSALQQLADYLDEAAR